jgi:hypothetical protein
MNVEATHLMHVKVKIKQGQCSRLWLGLGLDAHKKDRIKNKEVKNRGNSNMNVKTTFLLHVKVEIEHGQCLESRVGLGLNAEREDLITNNELKIIGNSNLNNVKVQD